jgi:hypothetical protein
LGRIVHHWGNLIPLVRLNMRVWVTPVQSSPIQTWELRGKVVGEMRNFLVAGGNMMQGPLLVLMRTSQVVDGLLGLVRVVCLLLMLPVGGERSRMVVAGLRNRRMTNRRRMRGVGVIDYLKMGSRDLSRALMMRLVGRRERTGASDAVRTDSVRMGSERTGRTLRWVVGHERNSCFEWWCRY